MPGSDSWTTAVSLDPEARSGSGSASGKTLGAILADETVRKFLGNEIAPTLNAIRVQVRVQPRFDRVKTTISGRGEGAIQPDVVGWYRIPDSTRTVSCGSAAFTQ